MARRPYVHLAGNLSGWPLGFVPTPAHMRKLDQFSSELVNGDEGGDWAPASPIVVGPYSSPNILLTTSGSMITGDIETVAGNSGGNALESPGMVLTGGNVPVFESNRTRTITVGLGVNISTISTTATMQEPFFEIDPVTFASRSVVAANQFTTNMVVLPIRAQHRGATITSVVFRYAIYAQRSILPSNMPKFRVIKVSADTIAPLHTISSGAYDSNGWYEDQAANATDYYNKGQTRTATYTPDQNHTSLDPSNAYWAVQFRNENTTLPFGVGNRFMSATVSLSSIANYQQE